jgi:hypothetical protein
MKKTTLEQDVTSNSAAKPFVIILVPSCLIISKIVCEDSAYFYITITSIKLVKQAATNPLIIDALTTYFFSLF